MSNFAFLGLGFPFLLIFIVVGIAIFIFEVCMFVNLIRNHSITDDRKVLWAIGMLILHPFVAIGYYFTDYRKQN